MSYETKTLGFALKQVHPSHPQFFIPAMQRPYVWQEDNLIALFESIYQGFPIGTSLIWRTKYDNPKDLGASRVFWVAKQYTKNMRPTQAHLDQGDLITLILDGQQRLTSLNIGVRGEWYKNKKKFTLCFDPNYTDKRAFRFINLDDEYINHLITCSNILDWEDSDYFDEYVKRWGMTNNGCMSSVNALIPLVRWVAKNNIDFATENNTTLVEIEKARKWFISALFSSAFSGNSAKTINSARKIVDASERLSFPFADLHAEMDSHHSHDLVSVPGVVRFLDGLSYKTDRHNLRLVLMLIKKNLKDASFEYELDHVFPKAQYEDQYPEKVHTIANVQLLTKKENNQKSNQTPTMLWSRDLFDENWREHNQLPRDKQIEYSTAIYDDPERLWQQRRALIAELVCDALELQGL